MKATKAYIASLGTTGVLLAAAVLMLAVVSAVVAFDRWPGAGVSTPVQTLVLNERPAAIRVSERSTAPSATPVPARALAGRRPVAAQPRAVGRAPAGAVLGEKIHAPAATPATPPASAPVNKTVQSVQDQTAPLFDAVSNPSTTASTVADGAQTVTDATGAGLAQASPQLGQTVTEAGQAVAQTVRDVPLPNHILPGH